MLTCSDVRPYLDFLGAAVNRADQNYQNLSDRLQDVSADDFQLVFSRNIRKQVDEQTGGGMPPPLPTRHMSTPHNTNASLFIPL